MDSTSPGRPVAVYREDVDLQLLKETKEYLECLFHRQSPSSSLIQSWERFYRCYNPVLRRYALGFHVHPADLDDCLQEVWKEVTRALRRFCYDSERGRFRSWLKTVVRSKVTNAIRRRSRHTVEHLGSLMASGLYSRDADPAADFARETDKEEVVSVLRELRRQVSTCNFRVLHMRWIEGCTICEIAQALGLTSKQVTYRHHRMKKKFRSLLDRHRKNGWGNTA